MDSKYSQGCKCDYSSVMSCLRRSSGHQSLGVSRLLLGLLFLSCVIVKTQACSCLYEHPQNIYCKADYVIKVRIVDSHMIYPETVERIKEAKPTEAPNKTAIVDESYEIPDVANLNEGDTIMKESSSESFEEGIPPEPLEPEKEVKVKPGESMEEEEVTTPPPFPEVPEVPSGPIYQSYKVNINKVFKGEEVIEKLVDKHHIWTNAEGSLCGKTQLSSGIRYLMMGKVYRGRLWISLCDHVQEWKSLTVRMRKNIHYNYDRNCDCKVENCRTPNCHKTRNNATCYWETTANHEMCYVDHAYCQLRTQNSCKWSRNSATVQCIQDSKKQVVDTMVLP